MCVCVVCMCVCVCVCVVSVSHRDSNTDFSALKYIHYQKFQLHILSKTLQEDKVKHFKNPPSTATQAHLYLSKQSCNRAVLWSIRSLNAGYFDLYEQITQQPNIKLISLRIN